MKTFEIEISDGHDLNFDDLIVQADKHFGFPCNFSKINIALKHDHFYPIGEDVLYTNTTLILTHDN